MTEKADAHDRVVAEADEEIYKQVWETAVLARATHACLSLHVTDWMSAQWEDPIPKTMIWWICNWRVQDLKHLLDDGANTEERKAILRERKTLMLYQRALYHCHALAGGLRRSLEDYSPHGSSSCCHEWDITEMLDMMVRCELCPYYMTSSGGLEWTCRCRKPLAAASNASNTKVFRSLAKLLGDIGANFESNIIKELCELMGIQKVWTPPYHTQTNGQVEQAHQTLMHMIGKLSKDQKVDWPKHLTELVHAYNSMTLVVIGYNHTI